MRLIDADYLLKQERRAGDFSPEELVVGKGHVFATPTEHHPAPRLGVFCCNQFTGHHPVGTAAVVVAENQEHAATLLNQQLKHQGLPGDATANMMALIMTRNEQVVVLNDGDY